MLDELEERRLERIRKREFPVSVKNLIDKELSDEYIEKELINIRNKEKKNTIEGRLNIIQYELGYATRSIYYSERFPQNKKEHIATSKLELAQLIIQINILCQEIGYSFKELRQLGFVNLYERYEDFNKDSWKEL